MSERKVFGRVEVHCKQDDKNYIIEMRKDGVFVRRKHCIPEFKVSFDEVLRLGRKQPELFTIDEDREAVSQGVV